MFTGHCLRTGVATLADNLLGYLVLIQKSFGRCKGCSCSDCKAAPLEKPAESVCSYRVLGTDDLLGFVAERGAVHAWLSEVVAACS
jgi:hypothetical protein